MNLYALIPAHPFTQPWAIVWFHFDTVPIITSTGILSVSEGIMCTPPGVLASKQVSRFVTYDRIMRSVMGG